MKGFIGLETDSSLILIRRKLNNVFYQPSMSRFSELYIIYTTLTNIKVE